jgi:SAM-dependent methyltransferase
MPPIPSLADAQYLSTQYQTAKNLNTRIQLHQRFSTNPYGWPRWVFDQFKFPPEPRIVELGCGAGDLWRENINRIPPGWQVTLSDSSAGMLQQARQTLGEHDRFKFEVIDAQTLPFENGSLDGMIANHMLYHVADLPKALSEIRRVLKPNGLFYAATIGMQHLKEIAELVSRFDPQLSWWGGSLPEAFTLENGTSQLAACFSTIDLYNYDDSLLVTEPEPLLNYILSGRLELSPEQQESFAQFVTQEFNRANGKFHVTKASGMFVASGRI